MDDSRILVPPFTADGLLPPGDYVLTLEQLTGTNWSFLQLSGSPGEMASRRGS